MANGAQNLQLYALASVYVRGEGRLEGSSELLTEEGSVTIDRSTGSQPVKTVHKGYSGESPGSAMTEISVDSAVPSSAFEMDPSKFMGELLQCDIDINVGGMVLKFHGFIISDTFSHSTDAEAKISFKARGVFSNWEQLTQLA